MIKSLKEITIDEVTDIGEYIILHSLWNWEGIDEPEICHCSFRSEVLSVIDDIHKSAGDVAEKWIKIYRLR